MNAIVKFGTFDFNAESQQEAYLKGCKILSKYVASNKYPNIFFKVVRPKDSENTSCKFELYCSIDMNTLQSEFCKICKEFHHSFFINENYNCDRCNMKSYLKRLNEKASVAKSYNRSKITRDRMK